MSLETLKTKVGLLIEKAQSGGNTDELEAIIDNSGVLDSTEGTVEEKVEQLIEKAEDGNAWYEQSALWTDHFAYLFKKSTNVKKLPRLRFDNATSLSNFAIDSNIEEIDYYIDSPKLVTVREAFKNTSKLKHIVGIDISNATDGDGFFVNSAIEEIDEPLNTISMPSYAKMITFNNCNNLRKISFVAESIKWSVKFTSAVLSDESIQSIIDGLATVETAQTLTLHADVKAKLTDEQKATITNKNWNLA